jgi:hypothetical protein
VALLASLPKPTVAWFGPRRGSPVGAVQARSRWQPDELVALHVGVAGLTVDQRVAAKQGKARLLVLGQAEGGELPIVGRVAARAVEAQLAAVGDVLVAVRAAHADARETQVRMALGTGGLRVGAFEDEAGIDGVVEDGGRAQVGELRGPVAECAVEGAAVRAFVAARAVGVQALEAVGGALAVAGAGGHALHVVAAFAQQLGVSIG